MKWIIEKITRCLNFLSPKLNTKIIFRLKMKRKLDLKEPTLFNDKIQYLKLKYYNSNKYIKELANKVTVRQHLDDIGMGKIKNDSFGIFNNAEDIPFNMLPNQFIIKWNFGSTLNYIVKDKKSENPKDVIKKLNKMKRNRKYLTTSELQYKDIKPQIIVEKYLEDSNGELNDYKFYCSYGKVYAVMVCVERNNQKPKFYFYDKDKKILDISKDSKKLKGDYSKLPKLPKLIDDAFTLSKKLSLKFPFVRIDLYIVNNKIYFGEYTFTPSAGLDSNMLKEAEIYLGKEILLGEVL